MTDRPIPRILLVDSEPRWSQIVKSSLQKQGRYDVEIVTDIETALDRSYTDGFNLILINAALALGENVSKLQEIVRLYKEKVLVISDVRSISTAIQVFKMGANYADKPFEPRRVTELIASYLQPARETAS